MDQATREKYLALKRMLLRAHPWHGVFIGHEAPEILTTYIEIVPSDTVKYELDKDTGLLKVDRPQRFSNVCPVLYGLVPQTYCLDRVAALCRARTGRTDIVGDGDPIDICVLSEKTFSRGDMLLQAIPIGGLRMIDGNEADDKIIAVMKNDASFGGWHDISDAPPAVIERLRHYFLTYKLSPSTMENECAITHVYGRDEAHEVLRASQEDYNEHYANIEQSLAELLDL